MCFRGSAILVLLVGVVASGCGLFKVNEANPKSKSPAIAQRVSQCVKGYNEKIAAYFRGAYRGDEGRIEIRQMTHCLVEALELFSSIVEGRDGDTYQVGEVRDFLEDQVFRGESLPGRLLERSVGLVKGVIGGPSKEIQKSDIPKIQDLIRELGKRAENLRHLMPLNLDRFLSMSPGEFDAAAGLIEGELAELGGAIGGDDGFYSFYQLDQLLAEVSMHSEEETREEISNFRGVMDVLSAAKSVLVAAPGDIVLGNEWEPVLQSLARIYTLGLRLERLNENYPRWNHGEGLDRFERWGEEVKELLDWAVTHQPEGRVYFYQINHLIEEVVDVGWLDWMGVDDSAEWSDILSDLVRDISQNFLQTPEDVGGIDVRTVELAWYSGFQPWVRGQRYLERLFQMAEGDLSRGTPFEGAQFSRAELQSRRPSEPFLRNRNVDAVIDEFPPLFEGEGFEFMFPWTAGVPDPVEGRRHSFHNLSTLSWLRVIFSMAIQGYAKDDRSKGLSIAEVQSLYEVIWDLGVKLEFNDPRKKDSGQYRAREADLFSPMGDGNGYLDESEGASLLAYLIASKIRTRKIYRHAHENCERGSTEVAESFPEKLPSVALDLVRVDCFEAEYMDRENGLWSYAPGFLDYYESIPEEDQKRLISDLADVARGDFYFHYIHEENLEERIAELEAEDDDDYELHLPYLRDTLQACKERTGLRSEWIDMDWAVDHYIESSRDADLDEDDQEDYQDLLSEIASASFSERIDPWLERGDTEGYSLIPHYVESVFQRFDHNRDSILDEDEGMEAFATFSGFLSGIKEFEDPEDVEVLFRFLLIYGRPPIPDDTGDTIKLGRIKYPNRVWGPPDIEATRQTVLSILAMMSGDVTK